MSFQKRSMVSLSLQAQSGCKTQGRALPWSWVGSSLGEWTHDLEARLVNVTYTSR